MGSKLGVYALARCPVYVGVEVAAGFGSWLLCGFRLGRPCIGVRGRACRLDDSFGNTGLGLSRCNSGVIACFRRVRAGLGAFWRARFWRPGHVPAEALSERAV